MDLEEIEILARAMKHFTTSCQNALARKKDGEKVLTTKDLRDILHHLTARFKMVRDSDPYKVDAEKMVKALDKLPKIFDF